MSRFALKAVVKGLLPVVLAATGATGCLSYPEEQDFGRSVQQLQAAQVAHPAMRPAPQDGQRARNVLEAYRQDVAGPQEIQNEIVINVGSGGQ